MVFSIIVTSHNQRQFIRDAVDSALVARVADTEVIVVDDASSDGSLELLREYGDAIRLVCLDSHAGACAARNQGASLAKGEYLVSLDGDDALQPWALRVYERVIRTRKPKLILASMLWFQGALPVARPGEYPQEIRIAEYEDYLRKDRTFGPSASAMVVDRQSFLDVGGWSNDWTLLDDVELLIKLSSSGRTVQILSPHTVSYRVHPGNTIHDVPGYVRHLHRLLQKEGSGAYPGGRRRRRERYAVMGGHIIAFVKRAVESGLYRDALQLFLRGLPVLFASTLRRFRIVLRGRGPCETIAL